MSNSKNKKRKKSDKELPLLATTLREVLETLHMANHSIIMRSLILADDAIKDRIEAGQDAPKADVFGECEMEISDAVRMIAIRGSDPEKNEGLAFSYLPKGKEAKITDDGKWAYTNRQVTSPVKVARALLESSNLFNEIEQIKILHHWCNYEPLTGIASSYFRGVNKYYVIDQKLLDEYPRRVIKHPVKRFGDVAYESFVNSFKASQECTLEFKLVSGEDIPFHYCDNNYYKGSDGVDEFKGTLWDSCMRDMSEEVFDLYVHCKNCQLLVAFKDDLVIGRALVWTTDKGTFMDRVYFYEDYHLNNFVNYAKSQGWMYKRRPDSSARCEIMGIKEGETKYSSLGNIHLTVTGASCQHDNWPYLDTFKYLSYNGTLTNNNASDWYYELESADGDVSQCVDDNDDEDEDEGDHIHCEISGDRVHLDDAAFIQEFGWVDSAYSMLDFNGNPILVTGALEMSNGSYISPNNPMLVTLHDGRWSCTDYAVEVTPGVWYEEDKVKWLQDEERWVILENVEA